MNNGTFEIKGIDRGNNNRIRWSKGTAKCVVYASSNIVDEGDAWFSKHQIYSLPFKCKAWTKVGNYSVRETAKIISAKLGFGVRWSRTAGCSCGCSPGYIAYVPMESEYAGKTVRGTVTADTTPIKALIAKCEPLLELEINNHS